MAVLLAGHLRYDFDAPAAPGNDHLIFSKGHASPLLYAVLKAAGAIDDEELLTLPQARQPAAGPPDAGAALGRRRHRLARPGPADRRRHGAGRQARWTGCPTASGCCAATARWPRARSGRRSTRRPTTSSTTSSRSSTSTGSASAARPSSAGTSTRYAEPRRGVRLARDRGRRPRPRRRSTRPTRGRRPPTAQPTVIVARRRRARASPRSRTRTAGTASRSPTPRQAIAELGGERDLPSRSQPAAEPAAARRRRRPAGRRCRATSVGDEVATRKAYGEALAALGAAARRRRRARRRGRQLDPRGRLRARRTPSASSRCSSPSSRWSPRRSGCRCAAGRPFASTFAAFFTRAYDFVRMAAISARRPAPVGLARGRLDRRGRPVADGARGPGDVARRARQHGAVPLRRQPDGARWSRRWPTSPGISYIRTTRGEDPVLYGAGRGRSRSAAARCCAPRRRRRDDRRRRHHRRTRPPRPPTRWRRTGIAARVIDATRSSRSTPRRSPPRPRETGGIVTVEDHWPEGGLGRRRARGAAPAPASPSAVVKLAVRDMPGSGTPEELLRAAGIDAEAIAGAARQLAGARSPA